MNKVLVIGKNGTLGGEFQRLFENDPSKVCEFVDRDELDITDATAVQKFVTEFQPNFIINCAAYTNVDGAEADYSTAQLLNATSLKYLSKVANEVSAKIIHFSTGMVFQGSKKDGYNEDDETDPINAYGRSKLEGEQILTNECHQYSIVRTEWLYGKPTSAEAKPGFNDIMIELGKSGKVKGVMDEIGKPTWARDLAQAVVKELVDSNNLPSKGIYHLANEGQASRVEWTQEIYKNLGMEVEIEPVSGSEFPRAAKRPHYELLNNTKLIPLRSWQDALKEYLTQSE